MKATYRVTSLFLLVSLLIAQLLSPAQAAVLEPYLVKDINPAGDSSYPRELFNLQGTLLFSAMDNVHGFELWKSDGTEAGTSLVKDINLTGESQLFNFIDYEDKAYFFANDGSNGTELWVSNGSDAGTALVKDINLGAGSSVGSPMVVCYGACGGHLYFSADDGVNGTELWYSTGTSSGTGLFADINPTDGSAPAELTAVNGLLFFTADDGTHGRELWMTDGSSADMVADLTPGADSSSLFNLAAAGNLLYFINWDSVHGYELWKSDGTEAGTQLVKDINPTSDSFPLGFTEFNGQVFFIADDGTLGYELWKSDGTEAGTVLVKEINPAGSGFDTLAGFHPVIMNNELFFSALDDVNGSALWKSDGTGAGTVLVSRAAWEFNGLTASGNLLFFNGAGAQGRELWQTNGTDSGTQMVKDIWVGNGSANPYEFTVVDNTLFFSVFDGGTTGEELWAYTPNRPPEIPTNLSPVDGSSQVDLSPVLSWGGGDPDGDTVNYTVYGQEFNSVVSDLWCSDLDANCSAPGLLKPNTRYLWQVWADDNQGHVVQGPFWEFTTVSATYTTYLPLAVRNP